MSFAPQNDLLVGATVLMIMERHGVMPRINRTGYQFSCKVQHSVTHEQFIETEPSLHQLLQMLLLWLNKQQQLAALAAKPKGGLHATA
jgi:hypothetical protein